MNRKIVLSITLFSLATSSAALAADPTCDNVAGVWHNQLGSTLQIEGVDAATGSITGLYRSPSGAGTNDFGLVGWVNSQPAKTEKNNATVISFTVRWGQIGSITAWVGTCQSVNGQPTISTLWHLARANSDFRWDHVLTGSDSFVPGPAPAAAPAKANSKK